MSTNQEIIESRLATYIDGELDDAERLEIEQHLQQNPQYRRVIEDLRKQRDLLRGLPRETAPLELSEAFTNQLERQVLLEPRSEKERPPMRIYAIPRIAAAAAIVFLTVGLATIVYFVLPGRNGNPVALSPQAQRPVPLGTTTAPAQPEVEAPDALEEGGTGLKPTAKGAAPAEPLAARSSDPGFGQASSKPGAAMAEKALVRQEIALNNVAQGPGQATGGNKLDASLYRAKPRDAELDELAKNVSQDPQVKALLADTGGTGPAADKSARLPQNAVVLVVRSNDPRQIQAELARFFTKDNIDWHPASQKVELALNTSLGQQSDDAVRSQAAANKREIDSAAVETEGARTHADEPARFSGAANQPQPVAPAPVVPAPAPGAPSPASPQQKQAPQAPAPVFSKHGEELRRGTAGTTQPQGDGAAAPLLEGAAKAAESQRMLSAAHPSTEAKKAFAVNAAPVDNLYVARHLTRRQADELNAYLAQSDTSFKSDALRRVGDYEYLNEPTTDVKKAIAPPAPAAPGSALASAAGEEHSTLKDAAPGAAPSANAARMKPSAAAGGGASNGVVQKGDDLRLRYSFADRKSAEQNETVTVKEDGTIAAKGRAIQVAGKTIDQVQRDLQKPQQAGQAQTNGAPATQPTLTVERVAAANHLAEQDRAADGVDRPYGTGPAPVPSSLRAEDAVAMQQRRASLGPSTSPAPSGADESAGAFDVVIVVQREPAASDAIAAPFKEAAAASPAHAAPPSAAVTPTIRPTQPATSPAK
jgi:hypothetical protein